MAGIKEMNLPVAESLGTGDKVRIVTAGGNSKQIDAGAIGGGSFLVTLTVDENTGVASVDKSYNDFVLAINSGIVTLFKYDENPDEVFTVLYCNASIAPCMGGGFNYYVVDLTIYDVYNESYNSIKLYATDPNANMTSENPCTGGGGGGGGGGDA